MKQKTDSKLTSRERLTRGLAYSAVGPVDVTRGAIGLGAHSLYSTAAAVRRRYEQGKLRQELAAAQDAIGRELVAAQDAIGRELAAAQEVVAGLPQALQDARTSKRRRPRPLVLAGAAVLTLAAGAAAFSLIRRSSRPSPQPPSPRPPSVDVEPKP